MPSVPPRGNDRSNENSRSSTRRPVVEGENGNGSGPATPVATRNPSGAEALDGTRNGAQDQGNTDGVGREINSRGGAGTDAGISAKARASQPISTNSSKPSFLSRLNIALPLRNRNRNVSEFHIECDEPLKKYSAGESVRGAVILAVVKPLRITHLVVSLHGFVQVYKDSTSSAAKGNLPQFPQGDVSGRPQYHGNGFASLFSDEQVLNGEGRLDPGKYQFNFDLLFPNADLPSSIRVSS